MILSLFTLLIGVALILVAFGYYVHVPVLGVIGFVLLFVLAVFIILPNQLQIPSGTTLVTSGNSTTATYNYAVYNDQTTHYFGYFLALISGIMCVLVMTSPGYNHEAD